MNKLFTKKNETFKNKIAEDICLFFSLEFT